MKTLLLLRHAKSSWNDPSLPDYQRSLNERGKRDAPIVGKLLKEWGLKPDIVLSSSAKRASKTAKKVIAASGYDVELRLVDELYLAIPTTYLAHVNKLPEEATTVLVVGHNPGIEELFLGLTGRHEHFPTAGLARVEMPVSCWNDVAIDQRGRVVAMWRPVETE